MTVAARIWMRHEIHPHEPRAPIVPADARRLVAAGLPVTVEESPGRAFALSAYADAGCRVAAAGGWCDAPGDYYIAGLKELPDTPVALRHRHVFFGHAYKGQHGGEELLRRFAAGSGTLLDLEYLAGPDGRRPAFGYWAGYMGAALAVLHRSGRLRPPLRPQSKGALDAALRGVRGDDPPTVLVIGALGRCGRGALDALSVAGLRPTCWDIAETRDLDRAALLSHDILVNAVLSREPAPPFLTGDDLDDPARRLALIVDVTCDVSSPCNMLPVNDRTTSWEHPVRRLRDGAAPLDIIALDNLPALVPWEASTSFSAALLPHLMSLGSDTAAWLNCERAFEEACLSAGMRLERTGA